MTTHNDNSTDAQLREQWELLEKNAQAFDLLARFCADLQRQKQWPQRSFGEECALFHSEISEALEEYRAGHPLGAIYYSGKGVEKPEGVPIELADVIIRIAAFCGNCEISLADAIARKCRYNMTRPPRHGGKII